MRRLGSLYSGILTCGNGQIVMAKSKRQKGMKRPSGVPSAWTIKRLFALSGNRCAFPECGIPMVDDTGTIQGVVCHIKAARPKGPRYDASQAQSDRRGFNNLVLMCSVHHKRIDNPANNYSVEQLQQIKATHEARCKSMGLEGPTLSAERVHLMIQGFMKEKIEEAVRNALAKQIDTRTKANLPELERVFKGGFTTLGLLTGSSATAGNTILKSETSHSIDVTWESARIAEVTPRTLTLEMRKVEIIRTQTTAAGTEPAGLVSINGKVVWQVDRRTTHVYINNAINIWGYVFAGYVIYDSNGVLIVAVGLQKVE